MKMDTLLKKQDAAFAIILLVFIATAFYLTRQQEPPKPRCNEVVAPPDQPIRFTIDFYGSRYTGTTDNLIDAHILYCGAWEKPILYFLRDVVASIPGAVFVDVGANTGQYSLFMSNFAKEVHAFEPYLPVAERFSRAITSDNIYLHLVGLGDTASVVPFFEPPTSNHGTGSFVKGFAEHNRDTATELQIVIGDEEFEKLRITEFHLMKMDIEAYEKPALHGLSNVLKVSRPIIYLELAIDPSLEPTFKSEEELRAAFPQDYQFLEFDRWDRERWDWGSGYYELQPAQVDFSQKGQYDIVAYPKEKAGLIPITPPAAKQP